LVKNVDFVVELLNHKRAVKLAKGGNYAVRTHRPPRKDQNFSRTKTIFVNFDSCLQKIQQRCLKGILEV
jgi:hypothetical protein